MTVKAIIKEVIRGKEGIAGVLWLGVEVSESVIPCCLVLSNFLVPEAPRVRVGKRFLVFSGQALGTLLPKCRRCYQAQLQVIGAIGTGSKEGSVDVREPDGLRIVVDYKQRRGSG